MKKLHLISGIVIVVVLVGAGVVFMSGDESLENESTDTNLSQELSVNGDDSTTTQISEVDAEKNDPTVSAANDDLDEVVAGDGFASFDLSMSNYEFSTTVLNVRPGDEVTIFLQSEEGTHDFVIDEFDVQSPVLSGGENAEFTFTVPIDASGSYEFYCSIGSHRALGMLGQLVVGE